ncbi:MAG: hypothetical protein AVDCRST_MAG59-1155 [uncultured Thermomicrobiales bacterium]|uniref:Uncharacterized protein n=1 Tax=uncultured Thermomicrobiales bacterium TaxID=1645740 RepID=A0A6J4UCE3_9BACT|nr:MAG: hypothetical protein AVDCRST_MAG59-1155 [uncultured Thermomicrobiales bacterium]
MAEHDEPEGADPTAQDATVAGAVAAQRAADAGARSGRYVDDAIGVDRGRTAERTAGPSADPAVDPGPDEPEGPLRRTSDDAVRALMAAVADDVAAAVAPLRDEIDALKAQHASETAIFAERLADQDRWIAELGGRVRDLEQQAPGNR